MRVTVVEQQLGCCDHSCTCISQTSASNPLRPVSTLLTALTIDQTCISGLHNHRLKSLNLQPFPVSTTGLKVKILFGSDKAELGNRTSASIDIMPGQYRIGESNFYTLSLLTFPPCFWSLYGAHSHPLTLCSGVDRGVA